MKVVVFGLILLTFSPVFAAVTYETELSAAGVETLRVDWSNGDVELIADDSASVRISAVGSRVGTALKTSDWLEHTDFSLTGSEAVLVFDTRGRTTNIAVDLTVRFPRGLRINVEAGNGDVVVSGGSSLEVDAGNGNLDVSGVAGTTLISAGNGDVDLEVPSGFTAEIELEVGNGDVNLSLGSAFTGGIEINAGNGDVTATFADAPDGLRIDAQTGMGSVATDLPGAEASEGFMGGSISRRGTSCSLEIAAGKGDIGIFVE